MSEDRFTESDRAYVVSAWGVSHAVDEYRKGSDQVVSVPFYSKDHNLVQLAARELNNAYRLGCKDAEAHRDQRSIKVHPTSEVGNKYGVLCEGVGYILMTLTKSTAIKLSAQLRMAYADGYLGRNGTE